MENKGESAITTTPQKSRDIISTVKELTRNSGDKKQQRQDKLREMAAILFTPKYWESIPLQMQAIAPDAMMRNDQNGTFTSTCGK